MKGRMLLVYVGQRYQCGGGSSIARFVMPIAHKFLMEAVKTAPSMAGSIVNKKLSTGMTLLHSLKTSPSSSTLSLSH